MGGDDKGGGMRSEVVKEKEELFGIGGVEWGERLVEKEEVWFAG